VITFQYTFPSALRLNTIFPSMAIFRCTPIPHGCYRKEFDQMKDGVYIINTSRGALIDEQALVDALRSGKGT